MVVEKRRNQALTIYYRLYRWTGWVGPGSGHGAVAMCDLPAGLGKPGEGDGCDLGFVEGRRLSFLCQHQAFTLRFRNWVAELL